MPSSQSRFRGCLLGLAVGDAVGTTLEFRPRGSFEPLTDMVGGGPFRLEAGQWTDDTSMALCLADSLLECDGFDPADQMRRYLRWLRSGHLSSTGECFDVGNTVLGALTRFEQTGEPFSGSTHPNSAGNGSIMRLAPVVLNYMPDRERVLHYAAESSRTTHGTAEAVQGCRILAAILAELLGGASREEALAEDGALRGLRDGRPTDELGHQRADDPTPAWADALSPKLTEITGGSFRAKSEAAIQGSGYVVRSLEAALWCFWRAESFKEAILRAANLGDDADTTAAVCGQLAGAYWGEEGIPGHWLDRLHMRDQIRERADRLWAAGS